MSTAPHPGRKRREEARGGGAREPRAVAGLLRRHGHAAHVPLHRALRDEPGRQGQVRRPVRRPVGQLRRPDQRDARHAARGLGARRPARRGGHRRRASPPASKAEQSEVDAAAAQAAAERATAGRRRGRRRPTTTWPRRATEIDAALTAAGYAGAARYEIDERGLVVHIVADAVLFDAEEAVLRPEGRAILDAVAPTLIGLPNVLRVEGHANHLPVTAGGPWPSNWELSAFRATTVLRYLGRRRRAGAADVRDRLLVDPAAGPRVRPAPPSPSTAGSTSSSCPPPRQRPTPCCRASTPHTEE